MPTRFARAIPLLAICVFTSAASLTSAGEPKPKMVLKTYYVADLVIPVGNVGELPADKSEQASPPYTEANGAAPAENDAIDSEAAPPKPAATQEKELIRILTNAISPRSWSEMGGRGTIDYHPLTMSLVVNQTPEIQKQIDGLLSALRRQADQEIAVEIRILSVPEDICESIGIEFGSVNEQPRKIDTAEQLKWFNDAAENPSKAQFLNDAQVLSLMEAVQGDTRTHITQAPKLTLFNGQSGVLDASTSSQFVTGVDLEKIGNNPVFRPKVEALKTGVSFSVQPVISADRRSVRLSLDMTMKSLVPGRINPFPLIVPLFEGIMDQRSSPITLTQLIQQPVLQSNAVQKTVSIADGGTVLLACGKKVCEVRTESCPRCLSRIPYVNRLFKNVGYSRETERVFVLVTPRIIIQEEEEAASPPAMAPQPDRSKLRQAKVITELLQAYDEACTEGHTDEAKKLARAALSLDPTCFRRK